ncbi:cellulose biosynthesis cyclic di-GMP-binding regulatory protein BcsB [Aliidiomarina soli]|uniref:Cyclic di-GMP-binding protein n=1 Tax=Aliidiomarina soli TaxID=1928574 RepID=A0A432WMR5_9GAMM|nr:cellulose biosynthesis cyclic di-GMP-binding regulatory protein BcsB [Aliidiomarina soli]RUO35110.1 hypothetical protein CWE14_03695 [Aliidiomarina soli]
MVNSYLSFVFAFAVLATVSLPSFSQDETASEAQDRLPTRLDSIELRDFDLDNLRISGQNPVVTVAFGSRIDELVTAASLTLLVRSSPLIESDTAQLVINLNGETIGARSVRSDDESQLTRYQFDIEPHYFSTYNELSIELIAGRAAMQCGAASPGTWVEMSGASTLELTKQQLRLENELAFFPEPFFDERSFDPVQLNLLTPEQPSSSKAEAMAMVAGYFGAQADWRDLDITYTALNDDAEWPEYHSIVFATHAELDQLGLPVETPDAGAVLMTDNPQHPAYKVMLVTGSDDSEVKQTAQSLVLTRAGLSGDQADLRPQTIDPRQPYAAPNWVSTQRRVSFSELVSHPSELQREGYRPAPINVGLRLPPDLFTWQRYGIPIDLRFRYTPPVQADESRLRVFINGQFTQAYTLNQSGRQSSTERVRIPLVSDINDANRLQLPAFQLSTINNLSLEYSFPRPIGGCDYEPANNTMGVIDGNSTIDLRGYHHYTALPNLHLFAKAGFPFTRYDDLSQSVFLLGDLTSSEQMITLLDTVAHMGASTGYPGVLLQVSTIDDYQPDTKRAEKDFVLISHYALQQFSNRFGQNTLQRQLRGQQLAGHPDTLSGADLTFTSDGPGAAFLAFESPLSDERSVVALLASEDEYLSRLRQVLTSAELSDQIDGFLTMLTPSRIVSYEPRSPYYVGELSWWNRMTYHVAQHPVVVVFFALLAVILIALMVYAGLARIAQKRQAANS